MLKIMDMVQRIEAELSLAKAKVKVVAEQAKTTVEEVKLVEAKLKLAEIFENISTFPPSDMPSAVPQSRSESQSVSQRKKNSLSFQKVSSRSVESVR